MLFLGHHWRHLQHVVCQLLIAPWALLKSFVHHLKVALLGHYRHLIALFLALAVHELELKGLQSFAALLVDNIRLNIFAKNASIERQTFIRLTITWFFEKVHKVVLCVQHEVGTLYFFKCGKTRVRHAEILLRTNLTIVDLLFPLMKTPLRKAGTVSASSYVGSAAAASTGYPIAISLLGCGYSLISLLSSGGFASTIFRLTNYLIIKINLMTKNHLNNSFKHHI